MKKRVLILLISLLSMLGFKMNVSAEEAPKTFMTGDVILLEKYLPDVQIYYKPLSGGLVAFCEDAGLKYITGFTFKLLGQVDDGYIYILENKPNTGDYKKDYYIQSVAVWWYKDYLNNTNKNLSQATKDYITNNRNTNEICRLIYNLVEGAKKYKQQKGYIDILATDVSFKEENGYYISDKITVKSVTNTFGELKLENAPAGTTIINNAVKNGNGTFQVKVPKTSLDANKMVTFKVSATGTYLVKKVYDYYYGSGFQQVIYGKVFADSFNVSDSISLSLTRNQNSLTIYKVDEKGNNLSGAELTLYKGNCVNTTCSDKYTSWTTTNGPKIFMDIAVGMYTLVETKTPEGYRTAEKMLINVTSNNISYIYKMVDKYALNVKISKTDITGDKEIPGATLEVKDEKGNIIESWVSTTESKSIVLEPGVYTLTETIAPKGYILNKDSITFKLDDNGSVYEKNSNGDYVQVDRIKMVNVVKEAINISKLDSESNLYLVGANLIIKNLEGETITSWATTNESHYVNLDEGEYVLSEQTAPEGYILNTNPIYFKVDADGNLFIKDANGTYQAANGIIMYNEPIPEVIEVPKTGLSSTLTYVMGSIVLAGGALFTYKNGKKC